MNLSQACKMHSRFMFTATKTDSLLERLPISETLKKCFCAHFTSGHKTTLQLSQQHAIHGYLPPHTYLLCNSQHLDWFRSPFVSCPLLVNPDVAKQNATHRLLLHDMNLDCGKGAPSISGVAARATKAVSCRRPSYLRRRSLKSRTSCRATSTSVSRSQNSIQSWADQQEKQLQNCRLSSSKDTPVLLTATSAQPGQCLLNVPDSSWISLQVVANSPIGDSVASLEPWLQLALFILHGLSQRDSDWSQYVLSLPTSLDVPLLWNEDELDLLEGTQLLSTVQGYR